MERGLAVMHHVKIRVDLRRLYGLPYQKNVRLIIIDDQDLRPLRGFVVRRG